MIFEIARLFPAFKPHEVAALPTRYYLKLRSYLFDTRRREQHQAQSEPGIEVIDFDEQYGRRSSSEE